MKCENCGRIITAWDWMTLSPEIGIDRGAIKTWDLCTECNDGTAVVTLKGSMEFISLEGTISTGDIDP